MLLPRGATGGRHRAGPVQGLMCSWGTGATAEAGAAGAEGRLTEPSCVTALMYFSSFSTFFRKRMVCSSSRGFTSFGQPPSTWLIPRVSSSSRSVLTYTESHGGNTPAPHMNTWLLLQTRGSVFQPLGSEHLGTDQ